MIKAIIFDFDGVLMESVDIKTKAFAKSFEAEDKSIVKKITEYHLQHTGVSRYDKFKYIYRNILNRGLIKGTFKKLCNTFSMIVADEVIKASYVKGAKEFLDNHAREYKCFVSSATPQKEMVYIIKKRNMSKYFKALYGSPAKKNDIVARIIHRNNLSPCHVVYIGDALSDYRAAKNNHINFIARINNNQSIFKDIECTKIRNLINLQHILRKIT